MKFFKRLYQKLVFWKLDWEYRRAKERMVGCEHARTIFVDVGSPPYDSVEKCVDCWALKLPDVSRLTDFSLLKWRPNMGNPRDAQLASRRPEV